MAKTVVFDFDGVIHSYTSGWQGEDAIPDPPVPGIRKALKEIHDAGYEVVVVSTRCATIKGHGAIEAWLYDNGLREYIDKVCKEKPPAVAYIDDRAICFDGHPETLLKKIQNFQPWYKMPTLTPPNGWVSVEERLPEDEARQYIEDDLDGIGYLYPCLLTYKSPNTERIHVVRFYYDITQKWFVNNGEELCEKGRCIAWMPLPAPYDRRPPEGEEDT